MEWLWKTKSYAHNNKDNNYGNNNNNDITVTVGNKILTQSAIMTKTQFGTNSYNYNNRNKAEKHRSYWELENCDKYTQTLEHTYIQSRGKETPSLVCVCVHVCMCVYINLYEYPHTHTHTHTHTHHRTSKNISKCTHTKKFSKDAC